MKKEKKGILSSCFEEHKPILNKSQKSMIISNLKDIVFGDVSEYQLLDIIDISEYITENGLDENSIINNYKSQKFLRTSDIKASPSRDSIMDVPEADVFVRYKYEGPRDSKNREFCSYMLSNYGSRYFRMEDINYMTTNNPNNDFEPYNYWLYTGSYGCRHKWKAYIFSFKNEIPT